MASKVSPKVVSISVSDDVASEFESLAREEGRRGSELFRDMLRAYRYWRDRREFSDLQTEVAASASVRGIRTQEDIERLVAELRSA